MTRPRHLSLITLALLGLGLGCSSTPSRPAARPMTDEDVATIFNHKPTGLTGSGDAVGQHLFAQEPALASTPVLVETASTGND